MISSDVHKKVLFGSNRPLRMHRQEKIGMSQAQKTQRLKFQIWFSFLSITHAFFVRFGIPAPVLNSELLCGSNAILHCLKGWVWEKLLRVKVNVSFFISYTVLYIYPVLYNCQTIVVHTKLTGSNLLFPWICCCKTSHPMQTRTSHHFPMSPTISQPIDCHSEMDGSYIVTKCV